MIPKNIEASTISLDEFIFEFISHLGEINSDSSSVKLILGNQAVTIGMILLEVQELKPNEVVPEPEHKTVM